ncbi:polysaccharide pyruvyl transferase family protein [Microbacterium sp. SA39]|uniref:polysaccharide pyruvyl transferase family protein n=1 Tax=Microbacterium sp. SA39 TaxID=1263625 RepID=UPI00061E69D6|nr:polysaccharide pyruvyl transferase family protein [Microbacterium sp. SA39]KJQ55085.1 hypothetical protein RS85_01144 [Microbacterium sp. SA39]
MSAAATGQTPTFLWLTGHVRNVGDSMLRRPLADLYRGVGPIRVWSGAPGSGYAAGLRISDGESASSFQAWAWEFTRAALRGRPTFVFNAGEFGVTKAYFFGLLALAPALILARTKGSRIVWVGAGVKNRRRYFMWPFDMLAKAAGDLRWRDVTSARLMGRGRTMPDWGFGIGPGGEMAPALAVVAPASRDKIAVSLRGDRREPSEEWLDAVERLAHRLDREIVCVVQVEDDNALMERVANRLGAEFIGWGDGDHWVQEQRVRKAYSRSVLTLSDRLHGLVIAATEGAVPLGWCEATTAKVTNHFEVIGADHVGPGNSSVVDLIDALDDARVNELSADSTARIADARARVDAVREELGAAEPR